MVYLLSFVSGYCSSWSRVVDEWIGDWTGERAGEVCGAQVRSRPHGRNGRSSEGSEANVVLLTQHADYWSFGEYFTFSNLTRVVAIDFGGASDIYMSIESAPLAKLNVPCGAVEPNWYPLAFACGASSSMSAPASSSSEKYRSMMLYAFM